MTVTYGCEPKVRQAAKELAEKLGRDVRDRDALWVAELRRVEVEWTADR